MAAEEGLRVSDSVTIPQAEIEFAAIRSQAATEQYVREQYELYDKLVSALGIRQ